MSPARLDISKHAKERLKQRGITRQRVREAMAKGQIISLDYRDRKLAEHSVGQKTLVVIYLEIKGGYLIVTAFWKGEA